MEYFTEVQGRFRGGPWAGRLALVRFEKAKPKIAVVVIDEPIEGVPDDITVSPSFSRHVYEIADEYRAEIENLTADDEVEFVYKGPMAAGVGRLN